MTTIVGKDAPLEQSIEHFTDTLKKLKIEVLEDNSDQVLPIISIH